MTKCGRCDKEFFWNSEVIAVDSEVYHKSCVNLFPSNYSVFTLEDDFLGEVEDEDGNMAYEVIDGLLEDEEESQ